MTTQGASPARSLRWHQAARGPRARRHAELPRSIVRPTLLNGSAAVIRSPSIHAARKGPHRAGANRRLAGSGWTRQRAALQQCCRHGSRRRAPDHPPRFHVRIVACIGNCRARARCPCHARPAFHRVAGHGPRCDAGLAVRPDTAGATCTAAVNEEVPADGLRAFILSARSLSSGIPSFTAPVVLVHPDLPAEGTLVVPASVAGAGSALIDDGLVRHRGRREHNARQQEPPGQPAAGPAWHNGHPARVKTRTKTRHFPDAEFLSQSAT